MRPATVLLALLLVVSPGLGIALALFAPARLSLSTLVALVVPLGYATVGLLALALGLLHALSGPALVASWTTGTAIAWWVALRRHPLRAHVTAWRREVAAERAPYLLGILLLAGFVVVRLTYSPLANLGPGYYTSFRYWADGLEMADAQRVPALSLQWGTLVPYTVSKIVLNGFHASASLVLGRGPLDPMGSLLFVVSIALFVAGFALARELGLGLAAPLVPVLLFAKSLPGGDELTRDLGGYRAENWGRLLALAAVVFAVRAFRVERPRWMSGEALLAGGLLGVCAATHLVPCVAGMALVGAYGLARAVLCGPLGGVVRRGLVVWGSAGVVGGGLFLVAPGAVGLEGVIDQDAYRSMTQELGLPESFDATRFLATGDVEQSEVAHQGSFYDSPARIYSVYARSIGGREAELWMRWVLPVAVLAGLAIVIRWGDRELKVTVGAALLFGASLLVAAFGFSLVYDVYVLARFGQRRLFDYTWIPAALLAAGALETVVERATRAGHAKTARVGATAIVVVAGLSLLAGDAADRGRIAYFESALGPLSWIERNVPCEGRILADRRTLASFEVFTRRSGVIEGMGPHLRPELLTTSVRETLAAREFFLDPDRGYLDEHGVAVIVATGPGLSLGGVRQLVPDARETLAGLPFLRVAVASPSMTVFEVIGADPPADGVPDVRTQPGYLCS